MLTVPSAMNEWTLPNILGLLEAHVYEDSRFDWKEDLRRDSAERFIQSAVAMANSGGGFFVFGVSDARSDEPRARIRGVASIREFAHEVTALLKNADLPVPHEHKKTSFADSVAAGQLLPIVQLRSVQAPHSYKGTFLAREGGATRTLATSEVRNMMMRREDTLARVRLLLLELIAAREAVLALELAQQKGGTSCYAGLIRARSPIYTMTILPLLLDKPELSTSLSAIRSGAEVVNYHLDGALSILYLPDRPHRDDNSAHAAFLAMTGTSALGREIEKTATSIAEVFGEPLPRLRGLHELR